ncbi:MAG: hypothetical protein CVU32_01805 [Betaproteobacteria bacterium HGW-Betaproteobacteria-5]|nr:MAG: hypothetical protein CVU32_01805 [Betaproteobacteria bacterium HGW-Betaproteobacteria-5]PKO93192.1 MAG: hypothetical protein CVU16_05810 [Betaproteobacteria bacterium HGW-Betaproteobacteria-10]
MSLHDSRLIEELAKRHAALKAVVENIAKQEGPRGKDGKDGAPGKSIRGEAGEPGPKGDMGPMPDHKWTGTKLTFQKPDGKWGKAVDLKGDKGDAGGLVVVRGGGSSTGIGDLLPGNPNVEPAAIVVQQGSQLVSLGWSAFVQSVITAADMTSELSRRADFVGDTILYRGEAAPGADENAAVWKIKRVEFVVVPDGKTDILEKFASGTADFVNAWSDRAALEYL